jgi:hypothetical protein
MDGKRYASVWECPRSLGCLDDLSLNQDSSTVPGSAQTISQVVVLDQTRDDVTCPLVTMTSPERQLEISEPPFNPETRGDEQMPSLVVQRVEPSPSLTNQL